jgi:putative ABC transport system ATP-binding protein
MDAVITAENVTRVFQTGAGQCYALKEVSMEACPGEIVVLRGRSGSGKTTLLNLLAGLDTPTEGEVYLKGKPLSQMRAAGRDHLRQHEIGMVFQTMALIPFLNAEENVELALRIGGQSAKGRRAKCEQWLGYVGLSERLHHRPQELSGGEQQRVAIARAVVREPLLLLADEPTAALDSRMGRGIMELFTKLALEKGICVVMTTHDPAMIERAHRVYALEDGRISQEYANGRIDQPQGSHQDLPGQGD